MDLNRIILACRKGDRSAQNELYYFLYENLLHITLRYMANREEANEIFNQAMLKIFEGLESRIDIRNFMGWATIIIKRTTIDYLRKVTNFKKKYLMVEDYSTAESISYNDVMDNMEVEEIFHVIQSLPQSERTIFSMYEIDGYKHKEISDILDISVSNSKYILHIAKKKLRNMLKNESSYYKNM